MEHGSFHLLIPCWAIVTCSPPRTSTRPPQCAAVLRVISDQDSLFFLMIGIHPPPVRGKRGRPDEGSEPNVGGKRFQARSSTAVPETVTQAQVNQPAQQDRTAPEVVQQPDVSVVGVGPPASANTSTPFEPVKSRRSRRLPTGVRALPIQTRTTPDRQAKGSKVRVTSQPQARSQPQSQPMPDPDAIEVQDIDIDLDRSPGSDMDAGSKDSAGTIVDWVIFV